MSIILMIVSKRHIQETLESIAPKNSQDRSAWGGRSPSKQNFAWTLNA